MFISSKKDKDNSPLANGSSLRLLHLPFYSSELLKAIQLANKNKTTTYLKNSNVEIRSLRTKEIILFIQYSSFEGYMEKEEITDNVEKVFVLNSRFDAVIEINPTLFKMYYSKHI